MTDRIDNRSRRIGEHQTILRSACILVWLAVVIAGTLVLIDYSSRPGIASEPALVWPADALQDKQSGRLTLVMILHPKCPCSRASVRELQRVLADCVQQPVVQPMFFCPDDQPEAWAHSDLWFMAANLSERPPRVDRGGRDAARFGATTSGHVLVYSAGGQRLFSGGITSGRGHEGDSFARQAITRILNGKDSEGRQYPVFGCVIRSPGA